MMPHVAWPASEEVFANRELIQTAFRISGIFPWDRSAVHWEKLDAGSLYTDKISEETEELLPAVAEVAVEAVEAAEAEEFLPAVAEVAVGAAEAEALLPAVAEVAVEAAEATEDTLEVRVVLNAMYEPQLND